MTFQMEHQRSAPTSWISLQSFLGRLTLFCSSHRYWFQKALYSTPSLFPGDTFCLSDVMRSWSISIVHIPEGCLEQRQLSPKKCFSQPFSSFSQASDGWMLIRAGTSIDWQLPPRRGHQLALQCKGRLDGYYCCCRPLGLWLRLEHSISKHFFKKICLTCEALYNFLTDLRANTVASTE